MKNIPGRGNSKYQGPGGRKSFLYLRNCQKGKVSEGEIVGDGGEIDRGQVSEDRVGQNKEFRFYSNSDSKSDGKLL